MYSNGTQIVTKGTPLGIMGSTGTSDAIHLHIDINNGGHIYSADITNDLRSVINPLDLYDKTYTNDPY